MNQLTTYKALERDGQVVLEPSQHCLWCLGPHAVEQCPDKYDFFPLNGNDECFLRACGVALPAEWVNGKLVIR